jgi:hypothetical protein
MRYPYDMWGHLANIYDLERGQDALPFRKGWYAMWAWVFKQCSLTDLFVRARVIHVTQFLISVSAVFYFSYVSIGTLFLAIPKTTLKYLCLWSTLIWLTIFATYSMQYQQVWILWYSINYQIALALFWYCAALAFALAFRDTTRWYKASALAQICVLSAVMLEFHPMELAYFFMYLLALCLVFSDSILVSFRAKWRTLLPMTIAVTVSGYLVSKHYYRDKVPDLIYYLQHGDIRSILDLIVNNGTISVNGLNRASASINELMAVTLVATIVFVLLLTGKIALKKPLDVRPRMLLLLMITSSFVAIPLFALTAGLATVIFMLGVENRIYYSSSLFVMLPIVAYGLLRTRRDPVRIVSANCCLAFVLLLTLAYSYYFSTSHTYYRNVSSLLASWDAKKVGFHLSSEHLAQIRQKIDMYEGSAAAQGKPPLYLARGDIAFILRYVFDREVFLRDHRHSPTLEEFEEFLSVNNRGDTYSPIIFETPPSFPEYHPFS